MPVQLVILAALGLILAGPARAQALPEALKSCRAVEDTAARLDCYDTLVGALPEIEFRGHGNTILPPFTARAGQMLRFDNSDAIFVAYLLDARGTVVQNLHQGGAGSGSFAIPAAGRYRLQINASGGWRVWLEQMAR
ncbi:hypothetical protein [Paenirhodobacter sp.]|uniref:hypothetical protein n=1 Tax=Paenirhodobacter sp. TaxID=1965326 RepID=UPI003B3C5BC1